jgi:hypothetical protein
MKRLSLSALATILLAGAASAATLSGSVTSVATCGPVSGQKVYVQDSATNWLDSTLTNTSGLFSFTIPSSITSPSYLNVYTDACGARSMNGTFYNGSSVGTKLITCGSYGIIAGQVKLGTTSVLGPSIVYLIQQTVNTSTMDTILTAVDSTLTSGYGAYNLRYACTPTGTYFVKAALLPAHPSYSSYLPTYYGNSLNWTGATALNATNYNGFGGGQTSVNLVAGTNPGGPAFIGGSVLLGANKTAGVGDPLAQRLLIVTDAGTGQAVAYTYSDAAGKFQFPALPYGTYNIFGDAMGKANPKLSVTVSATNKTVNNIIFEENDTKFEGHLNTTGVGRYSKLDGVSVFPNPATDFVNVKGLTSIDGSKTITLSNITGTVISRETITQGDASVSTSVLPAGIYMLQVQTVKGNATFQIVK